MQFLYTGQDLPTEQLNLLHHPLVGHTGLLKGQVNYADAALGMEFLKLPRHRLRAADKVQQCPGYAGRRGGGSVFARES